MKRKWSFCLAALLVGLGGCATTTVEPRNLSLLKEEILGYVDSGRYEKEIEAISKDAIAWIERRAKNSAIPQASRLAVVFDIDETMLSNLPHMRAMDFGYQPAAWDAWVARGEAPVIEPVRKIYRRVRQHGVEVIFITGRREHNRTGTEKNLLGVSAGDYAHIFLKPDESEETTKRFKTATRARLVSEGWVIIANIGDQESDLAGGFAEKTFKLPAPFYLSK
jgi:predicted secreted acid phosphatase